MPLAFAPASLVGELLDGQLDVGGCRAAAVQVQVETEASGVAQAQREPEVVVEERTPVTPTASTAASTPSLRSLRSHSSLPHNSVTVKEETKVKDAAGAVVKVLHRIFNTVVRGGREWCRGKQERGGEGLAHAHCNSSPMQPTTGTCAAQLQEHAQHRGNPMHMAHARPQHCTMI